MLRFHTKEGLPVVYSIDGINGTIIWENVNGKETIIRDYFEKKLKEQKEKKEILLPFLVKMLLFLA